MDRRSFESTIVEFGICTVLCVLLFGTLVPNCFLLFNFLVNIVAFVLLALLLTVDRLMSVNVFVVSPSNILIDLTSYQSFLCLSVFIVISLNFFMMFF